MSELTIKRNNLKFVISKQRTAQRGQSVVFALLALLILSFAGALFIGIVTHNLQNSKQNADSGTAQSYAQAGIQFADAQLTTSLLGADWRPPRQNLNTATNDPDYNYIMNLGYTRYNYGSGRFLLRVTYNPTNQTIIPPTQVPPIAPVPALIGNTLSSANRYIKIDCIGETGTVDTTDPTTFASASHSPSDIMVAYKQIGLTDYTRFITDPNKTGAPASIGVPTLTQTNTAPGISGGGIASNGAYSPGVWDFASSAMAALDPYPLQESIGAPDAYIYSGANLLVNDLAGTGKPVTGAFGGGGSLRSNTSVRFYGLNNIYLDRPSIAFPDGIGMPAMFDEGVEIAGNVLEDGYTNAIGPGRSPTGNIVPTSCVAVHTIVPTSTLPTSSLPLESTSTPASPTNIVPSGSTLATFDTAAGGFRDGGAGTSAEDANGYPRLVNRLEPPVMDAIDPYSSLPRFRAITANSSTLSSMDGEVVDGATAAEGYGRFTYINNFSDIQTEASQSLPAQWTDEATPAGGWQNNDIYSPPGISIEFGPQSVLNPDGTAPATPVFSYGYRINRTDKSAGSPIFFDDVDGNTTGVTNTGLSTLTVLYSDLGADSAVAGSTSNDVIIYAEGNVRLSGTVSANPADGTATAADKLPRHVTIVTNGTAYIDGSLLKGNPDSSIVVLAHDYVCVNTTQFFAGKSATPFPTTLTPATGSGATGAVPHFVTVNLSTGANNSTILQEFNIGLPNGLAAATVYHGVTVHNADPEFLYLSAQAGSAPAPANPDCEPSINFLYPSGVSAANVTFGLVQLGNGTIAQPTMDHDTFPITGLDTAIETPTLQLEMQVPALNSANQPNLTMNLERAAVLPGDVRIEAVLFAQTKSFFVIPGPWFNSNSTDTMQLFISNGVSPSATTPYHGTGATPSMDRFPFYGQPVDLKIIVAGSIVEANTADIGAQTKWMDHWGWIPQFHGSTSGEPNGHSTGAAGPSAGLTIIYDPTEGAPFDFNSKSYFRTDSNGNPLPFAPALPVCPGLIYEGEASSYQATGTSQLLNQ